MFWEQIVTKNCQAVKYSLNFAVISFGNFMSCFKNVGGAQAIIANVNFQEEIFDLEQMGRALLNRTSHYRPPSMVRCQYAREKVRFHYYATREPKTSCVDYGI